MHLYYGGTYTTVVDDFLYLMSVEFCQTDAANEPLIHTSFHRLEQRKHCVKITITFTDDVRFSSA